MSISDLTYAVRRLRHAPGFVLVAIVSLALSIGFTASVFGIVQALFGRDLDVTAPEELVALSTIAPERPDTPSPVMLSVFEELRRRSAASNNAASSGERDFAGIFAWRDALLRNVEVNGVKSLGAVNEVSGEYFAALGVQPLLGRVLTTDDVASIGVGTSARVAVLDYRCWEQRFGRDPHVLGKTLIVDGTPLTIVGVMPERFVGLNIIYPPDAIVPIGFDTGRIPDRQTAVTSFSTFGPAEGRTA